jgi:hypothetical protein
MNGNELLCFCRLCPCGNKEISEVNREVISALKQRFIVPITAGLCFNISNLTLHKSANCIARPTHVTLSSILDLIQNVQPWDRGLLCRLGGGGNVISNNICYSFLSFCPLLMASFICWYQKHVISALSTHCCHMLLV